MGISVRLQDEIGLIAFNRPESRNAISKSMWEQIPLQLDKLKNEGARIIVFRGEGSVFASGADLVELEQLDNKSKAEEHWAAIRNALNAVANIELPVVAMIQGPAMGGGCLLAAACDLRYCTVGSSFAVPVTQLGIKLDDDNLARLLALLGKGPALELLLTGMTVGAAKAERIGLVNGVANDDKELEALVDAVCDSIKKNVPSALQYAKRALDRLTRAADGHLQDQEEMVASYLGAEFRKRVSRALVPKKQS